MPMNWNAEADAKLFLGVLNQLKDAKLKLDYNKLAEFMGTDCLPGAVHNRIVRLRRKAEVGLSGADDAGEAEREGDGAGGIGDGSPQKRKVQRKPKGSGAAKKAKAEDEDED
ncbi:hypothetical protein BDW62DRAFT_199573 [Aspergillus aurantiobrunneus]